MVLNLPLKGEWLFLHLIIIPAQIAKHIKMDFSITGLLAGACCFIHLCATRFYMAFCHTNIGLGRSLVIPVQKNKAKDLVFSFHPDPLHFNLGYFTNQTCTKLVGIKSYHDTLKKS